MLLPEGEILVIKPEEIRTSASYGRVEGSPVITVAEVKRISDLFRGRLARSDMIVNVFSGKAGVSLEGSDIN